MASYVPPMPPPAAPPKKTSPVVWILLGCAGFILLIGIAAVVALSYGWHMFQRNPAATLARIALAANPNAEVVSMDEDRGKVVIRDKRTGKTVTLNLEDVKKGRISFEGERGEKVTIEGEGEPGAMKIQSSEGTATFAAGGPVKLPAWFPAYAGVTPRGTYSVSDNTGDAAGFQFTTKDAPEQVLQFYESGLKSAGLKVTTLKQDNGGMVSGQDEGEQRQAVVTVSASDGATQVSATFKSKK
ncbi:MAG: hypothetical protein ABSH05_25905 [Bryobacteraceae bacterium]